MAGRWELIGTFADDTPAAAGVVASAVTKNNLQLYNMFRFTCLITAGTGGTTDVTIQGKVFADTWVDWARTPAVPATTTVKYMIVPEANSPITVVGTTNDALTAYTVILANGVCCGGHPGGAVRCVYTAGAGTSVKGAATVYLEGRRGD